MSKNGNIHTIDGEVEDGWAARRKLIGTLTADTVEERQREWGHLPKVKRKVRKLTWEGTGRNGTTRGTNG